MTSHLQKMKHTPQRSCCSCRLKGTPEQFLRFTWDPKAGPQLDAGVKKPGRGAYVCPHRRCIELAVKKGAGMRTFHKQWTAAQAEQFYKSCMARISEKQDAETDI